MWLPLEENHEVTGFVRAVGGAWHCREERYCKWGGHCGGGRAQIAHSGIVLIPFWYILYVCHTDIDYTVK